MHAARAGTAGRRRVSSSQLFANVYLDRFDHFVTEVLRAPYLRYVDDCALFADDPARLAAWRDRA